MSWRRSFVCRRNMASNSADVGKFRQRAHERSHCSSLSALPNSTGTLSFSLGCLPFTLLLSDRSLLPLSYLHRLPKQGPPSRQPPTSRHNLSTLALLFVLLPPHQTHHRSQSTILIVSPIPSTFVYTTHIRLQLNVQSRGFKNAHKFFN